MVGDGVESQTREKIGAHGELEKSLQGVTKGVKLNGPASKEVVSGKVNGKKSGPAKEKKEKPSMIETQLDKQNHVTVQEKKFADHLLDSLLMPVEETMDLEELKPPDPPNPDSLLGFSAVEKLIKEEEKQKETNVELWEEGA